LELTQMHSVAGSQPSHLVHKKPNSKMRQGLLGRQFRFSEFKARLIVYIYAVSGLWQILATMATSPPRGNGSTADEKKCAICENLLPPLINRMDSALRKPLRPQEQLRNSVLCPPPRRTVLSCGHDYHRHCGQWLAAAGAVASCLRCTPRPPGAAWRQHVSSFGDGKAANEARAENQLAFDDAACCYVKAAAWVAACTPASNEDNKCQTLSKSRSAPRTAAGQTSTVAATAPPIDAATNRWDALPPPLAGELADAVAVLRRLTGEHSGAGGGGTKALERGFAPAQVLLARLWQRAEGVPRVDLRRSLRLLQAAAAQAHSEGQFALGQLMSEWACRDPQGAVAISNPAAAVALYAAAASQGHAGAAYQLGYCYEVRL